MSRLALPFAASLALLAGCAESPASGPSLPLGVVMDAATAQTIAELQFTFVSPRDRFFCLDHRDQCATQWISTDQPLRLVNEDGSTHPSRRIALSADPAGTSFSITGVPPTKSVVLIVEGLTKDSPPKLAASQCVDIAEIVSGDNAAVTVQLVKKSPPLDCDPRFEK